jgi:hypothetical protein
MPRIFYYHYYLIVHETLGFMDNEDYFFDDESFKTDSDDDGIWAEESEVNEIDVVEDLVIHDAFLFDQQTLRTHVHNTLVSVYKNKAYDKRWINSFNVKVNNYVDLLMNIHAVSEGGDKCSIKHKMLELGHLYPVIEEKPFVVDEGVDAEKQYFAQQKLWTVENSESSEWESILVKWGIIANIKPFDSDNQLTNLYKLLAPFNVDSARLPLVCMDSIDALNMIPKNGSEPHFSHTKIIGPHSTNMYPGDHVLPKGFLVRNDPYVHTYTNVPVMNISDYVDRIRKLKRKKTVMVYFHDFVKDPSSHDESMSHSGDTPMFTELDESVHEYKITDVTDEEIQLKPTSSNFPHLVYNKTRLSDNPFMLYVEPKEGEDAIIPKYQWFDKNVTVLFDMDHSIEDQIQLCITTPSQRLFWLVRQTRPRYYNLKAVVGANPELKGLSAVHFDDIKQYIEKSVSKLPKVKTVRSVSFEGVTVDENEAVSSVEILNFKGFKWEGTYIDTLRSRLNSILKQKDYGLSKFYKSILKDTQHQIEYIEAVHDTDNDNDGVGKKEKGKEKKKKGPKQDEREPSKHTLNFQSLYPKLKVFGDVQTLTNSPPEGKEKTAILNLNGVHVLVKKTLVNGQAVWEIEEEDDESSNGNYIISPSANMFISPEALESMHDKMALDVQQDTEYKSDEALHNLRKASSALKKEVKKWKTISKRTVDWWTFKPRELKHTEKDDREFLGDDSDDDVVDIQEGEGYGVYYDVLKDDADDDDDEILDAFKSKDVDSMKKFVRMVASNARVNIKGKDLAIVANYLLLHHNKKTIQTAFAKKLAALKSQEKNIERSKYKDAVKRLEKEHTGHVAQNDQDVWFTICAFFVAFALIYKPKPIISMEFAQCIQNGGRAVTKDNLIRYMSCYLNLLSNNVDDNPGLEGIKELKMSDITTRLGQAFKAILNNSKQLAVVLAKKGSNLKDEIRQDLNNLLGSVWTTFRPPPKLPNPDEIMKRERKDKKHVVAAAYVMYIQSSLGDKPLLKQSYNPACCLEGINTYNQFWKSVHEGYEHKDDIVKLEKVTSKKLKNQRMHVLRFPRNDAVLKPMLLDLDIYNVGPNHTIVPMTELSKELTVDEVSDQQSLLEFMQYNEVFENDSHLRTIIENMNDDDSWGVFSETVKEMYEKIEGVLEEFGNRKIKSQWDTFVQSTLQLTDLSKMSRTRDMLFNFIQNDMLKMFARSKYDHRVAIKGKDFIPKVNRKEYTEYLIEDLKESILYGDNVTDVMSIVLEQGSNSIDLLKFKKQTSKNDMQNNIFILSYVLAKLLILMIDGIQNDFSEDTEIEDWDWEEFVADSIEGDAQAKIINIFEKLFNLFIKRKDVGLIDVDKLIAEYELQREDRKQEVMNKMENMSKDTKQLFMKLKNKDIARFVNMENLADLEDIHALVNNMADDDGDNEDDAVMDVNKDTNDKEEMYNNNINNNNDGTNQNWDDEGYSADDADMDAVDDE